MAKSSARSSGSSVKTSDSNVLAAVSYLFGFLSGIILYLVAGNDRYVKFHAAQSTFWFLGLFVLNWVLLLSIVGAILSVYGGAGSQYRFIKDVGKLADYMLDGNHWYNPKHPRIKGIITAFEQAYSQPFAYEWMLAYQSGWVLKDALERAGAADRDKVREALTRTRLTDQIVPYPITFDEKGQNPGARTLLMQVQNGRIAVVYPPEFAEAKPAIPVPAWDKRM